MIKNIVMRRGSAVVHILFKINDTHRNLLVAISKSVSREFMAFCLPNDAIIKQRAATSNCQIIESCCHDGDREKMARLVCQSIYRHKSLALCKTSLLLTFQYPSRVKQQTVQIHSTRFFLIKTSKFWPRLIVRKVLHNLSLNCS